MITRTIMITGCQSGIGKVTAQYFQAKGWNVVATMLQPDQCEGFEKADNLLVLPLDVEDKVSIHHAVQRALSHFDKIDVLFNNAGFAVMGVFEAATDDQIQKQFRINVFGLMDVTRAVLPSMRQRGCGLIINASSSAGRYSWPLLSLYNATKCAIEGLSETLFYELAPLGIGVKIIEMDKVKTDFGRGVISATLDQSLADYEPFSCKVATAMSRWGDDQFQLEPEAVAELVFEASNDNKRQLRYLIGDELKFMVHLKASLSDEAFTSLVQSKFS